jgi:hypothetical protein
MGKGSKPRPMEIDREEYHNKFDAIDWSNSKPKKAKKVKTIKRSKADESK